MPVLTNIEFGLKFAGRRPRKYWLWGDEQGVPWALRDAQGILTLIGLSEQAALPASALTPSQQRLLEIGMALAGAPRLILFDEPAAGLHHSMVEKLVDALGDRQVFAAVSGPTFLDYVSLDKPEDARKTLVLCRQEAGLLTYRHPSEEEAKTLAWKYRVGLQQTGELLRAEGLW